MVVLTVTERDLPLLQFFTALPVKLQAMVTGSTDVISEDVAHVVQHTAACRIQHFLPAIAPSSARPRG